MTYNGELTGLQICTFIFIMPVSSLNPMFDHLLESSHREEITQVVILHILSGALLEKCEIISSMLTSLLETAQLTEYLTLIIFINLMYTKILNVVEFEKKDTFVNTSYHFLFLFQSDVSTHSDPAVTECTVLLLRGTIHGRSYLTPKSTVEEAENVRMDS